MKNTNVIIVNGYRISDSECETICVALEKLKSDLKKEKLDQNSNGYKLLENIDTILNLFNY